MVLLRFHEEIPIPTMRRALSGFQLSYIFSYGSALPFNIVLGTIATSIRTLTIGRWEWREIQAKGLISHHWIFGSAADFSSARRCSLETLVEGFNVFNRANLQLPNNVFGTGITPLPSFGQPTGAADPRQLQFGLRLSF